MGEVRAAARKKRSGRHRTRLNWIVIMMVSVVVAFCALSSIEEKHGLGLGMPNIGLPAMDVVFDRIEAIFRDDDSDSLHENALAVSGPVSGEGLAIHFIDVGQGKAVVILGPKQTVLIDAGESDQGAPVLRYLREIGVQKLDIVIGTHPHSDHIGGLDTVLAGMDTDMIIMPMLPDELVPATNTYTRVLEQIAAGGLTITPARVGDSYDLGDGAVLSIIGPIAVYSDLNNMSVVCRLSYGETSFLFTGDLSEQAELGLVEAGGLKSDVLDVGHHGSNSSSSELFMDAVRPRIAIISCGLDNSYGHPHREVMERLQARDVDIYRTDLDGSVVVISDGERIRVRSEN